jgi:hypothetical protein
LTMHDHQDPRVTASDRKRLRDAGLELELEQIPVETGDKDSGSTTLPRNQEEHQMPTEEEMHQEKSKHPHTQPHDPGANVERSAAEMAREMRGLHEAFRRQNTPMAQGIKLAAIGVTVFAAGTAAALTANAIVNRDKPAKK